MSDAETGGGETVPEVRASDQDRETVVQLLAVAAGDGQLTLEEYSERVDVALAARTRSELAGITGDLQQANAAVAGPAAGAAPELGPQKLTAVLASNARKGQWTVPAHLKARAVLGECTIELQSAVLTSRRTVIEAHATLGSIVILVPEGVEVDLSGSAILGSKESEIRGTPAPGAPVIEIRATAVLGEVVVRHPAGRSRISTSVNRAIGPRQL